VPKPCSSSPDVGNDAAAHAQLTPRVSKLLRDPLFGSDLDAWVGLADRLEREATVRAYETARAKAQFDAAVAHLSHIYAFIQADDVVLPDGRRFKFTPPDEHVRIAWEGLSKAIREIPAKCDAAAGLGLAPHLRQ
jgi:hypothetical protein